MRSKNYSFGELLLFGLTVGVLVYGVTHSIPAAVIEVAPDVVRQAASKIPTQPTGFRLTQKAPQSVLGLRYEIPWRSPLPPVPVYPEFRGGLVMYRDCCISDYANRSNHAAEVMRYAADYLNRGKNTISLRLFDRVTDIANAEELNREQQFGKALRFVARCGVSGPSNEQVVLVADAIEYNLESQAVFQAARDARD